ncbi:MAG: hypothetical protein NTV46_18680, partial [Verrucomicrobia bacterium]|nr:hypothetical protein [Verrucomicrobiota bacterium]
MKFANLMAKLADERRAWMFLSNQGYGNHIFRFAENRGFPDSEKLCGFAPLRENLFREIVDGADDSITRILLENRRSFGFLVGVACKKMARRTNQHTWKAFKEGGQLQERHVLMAMDLGMSAGSIMQEHALAQDRGDLLLLEWVEDRFFARHGHYAPISDATPENQAEHPAENSLLMDHDEAIRKMLHIAH